MVHYSGLATRTWIFYAALTLVLVIIIQGDLLPLLLPDKLADQVGNQGEAVVGAMLMAVTIQFVRPRVALMNRPYVAIIGYALTLAAIGIYLLYSSLPGQYATYSEPFVAAGVLAVYFQVPRPFSKGLWLTPIMLAIIVIGFDLTFVLQQSENLVWVMLAPIAFDVVDRRILDPSAEDRPRLRIAWCASLVAAWLVAWQVATAMRPDIVGPLEFAVDYAHRASEVYWGLLLIHLYFSYWLGWVRRTGTGSF